MKIWKFKKLEPSDIRGICVICNKNPQKKVSSKNKYRAICSSCDDKLYSKTRRTRERGSSKNYKNHKKLFCEFCGFIAVHKCQLDVDHIDGNHENNDPLNLQTLCANCHRLKTYVNSDGIFKNKSPKEINP